MSDAPDPQAPQRRRATQEFARHVRRQPTWHRGLLLVMLLLGTVGIVGHVRAWVARPKQAPVLLDTSPSPSPSNAPSPQSGGLAAPNSRGFVSGGAPSPPHSTASTPDAAQTTTPSTAPPDDLLTKVSPYATQLGIGYVAGFVIGWVFRFFLKMMALVAVLIAALSAGLSYFGVVNVDLTPAKQQYESARHWAMDQGERLKDAAVAHLPSGAATTAGLFFGFRRRRID